MRTVPRGLLQLGWNAGGHGTERAKPSKSATKGAKPPKKPANEPNRPSEYTCTTCEQVGDAVGVAIESLLLDGLAVGFQEG